MLEIHLASTYYYRRTTRTQVSQWKDVSCGTPVRRNGAHPGEAGLRRGQGGSFRCEAESSFIDTSCNPLESPAQVFLHGWLPPSCVYTFSSWRKDIPLSIEIDAVQNQETVAASALSHLG